jgi:hypothetical protein
MTESGARIALTALETPDWNGLMLAPAPEAADALKSILTHGENLLEEAETRLTTIRESIFNLRMCAFRIVSERELWKLDTDPEYGVPYKSMHRWMQVLYPGDEGLRYAIEANSTQKALPAATLEDLAQIPRCNAVTLASKFVSDGCRTDRSVIEAAKTASEKQFRETLNTEHNQHLESSWTLKLTGPQSAGKRIEEALDEIGERENIEDRFGQLEYLVEDYRQGGHSEDVE